MTSKRESTRAPGRRGPRKGPNMDEIVAPIVRQLARLDGVVAVAQGGSSVRQSGGADEGSDMDLYAFVREPLELNARRALVDALGIEDRTNLGVDYWGTSDQWVDSATGRHVDLMYFEIAWMREEIESVLDRRRVRLGYTTCFCYTLAHARPLLDSHGWLDALQRKCREPYPEPLRKSVVEANHRAMRGILSSYERQIRKAVDRGDRVSVNHRLAALLASYFDVIFAVNRQLHPGEKRLIALAEALCPARPANMHSELAAVLAPCGDGAELTQAVTRLLDHLDQFLAEIGF
jgi:Domain of unknown function (DUF4037)